MKEKNNTDKPHYIDHRSRLRDRFIHQGINGLQPYEIIELFLTFVIPQKDVKPAAKEAIDKFGTIKGFFDADEKELSQIPFFKDKALALRKFIKEISLLYYKQQAEQIPITQSKEELISYCKAKLDFSLMKNFGLFRLTVKMR